MLAQSGGSGGRWNKRNPSEIPKSGDTKSGDMKSILPRNRSAHRNAWCPGAEQLVRLSDCCSGNISFVPNSRPAVIPTFFVLRAPQAKRFCVRLCSDVPASRVRMSISSRFRPVSPRLHRDGAKPLLCLTRGSAAVSTSTDPLVRSLLWHDAQSLHCGASGPFIARQTKSSAVT